MTNQTHHRIAAAGLVIGPLLFTVGDLVRRLVEPTRTTSPAVLSSAVARHGDAWALAAVLSAAAGFCLVPGAIALVATARGRGARLTTIGGGLLAVGAVAAVGHAVAFYSPYALYGKAHVTGPTLTAMDSASESYPLLVALIVLFIAGMVLGPLVLCLGLRRAGRVPTWAVIAAVVFVVTGGTSSVAAGAIGVVAAMVAFVPAALSVAQASLTTAYQTRSATRMTRSPTSSVRR